MKTLARRKSDLLAILPDSILLQREVLKHLIQDFEVEDILVDHEKVFEVEVHRSTIFRHRRKTSFFLQDCYLRYDISPEELIKYLAQRLVAQDYVGFF